MMILVGGATSDLGTAICRRLRDRGLIVGGLVRGAPEARRVRYLSSLGVTPVRVDPDDRTGLEYACRGAEAVITAALLTRAPCADETGQPLDLAESARLVEAARASEVHHVVYVTCPRQHAAHSSLAIHERALEREIVRSGLTYSILRSSLYMEVWLSPAAGFDYPSAAATLPGMENPLQSWISRGDVAAFAVAALDHEAAQNAELELGGPQPLSLLDVVRIFEETSSQRFAVQRVSEQALRAQLRQSADPLQQCAAALLLDCTTEDVVDMRPVLQTFPVRLLTVAEYARHMLLTETIHFREFVTGNGNGHGDGSRTAGALWGTQP